MCGICGYAGIQAGPETIEAMARTLSYRGPDGWGYRLGDGVGLGHTRLAIIDLTDAASQPMSTPDGRYHLVFNGEIYNYRELCRELIELGHTPQSASDTEVILLGYRAWGRDVLHRLRGMFAFAIWDEQERRLFMARDRIGIKPLFYALLSAGIVFGSEIKALLAHPAVRMELNPAAIDAYLALGYVPGPNTIFRSIRALMPGCRLEWKNGDATTSRFWMPDFRGPALDANEDDLADELDARLNDAVRSHLVADVPVGAFLSGGVDSSLVAAIAQRHSTEALQTFTIGFTGGGDERSFARIVSSHIGSIHRESIVEPDITRFLPRLVWHLNQPLFDNSILPTFLVSQLARERVKVVVSGDGGDEPFAGYDWTRHALTLPDLPIPYEPPSWEWCYQRGWAGLLKRLIYDTGHGGDGRYLRRMTVSRELRRWLYTPEYSAELLADPVEGLAAILSSAPVRDKRERFLYSDLVAYLPEDVLFKVDRMSMASALEVRVPLLDHELLEWVMRLGFSMRFRGGRGKYLLRKVAGRYLPPSILKPRKQGFTVPVGRWLHGQLGEMVKVLFSSRAFEQRGIIRPRSALDLLEMHRSGRCDLGHRIWSLVILEVWMKVWLDNHDPGQTLLDLLTDA